MANVDKATRILNFVSSDEYSGLDNVMKGKYINEFFSINDNNKPKSFRGLNMVDISTYFDNLNLILKEKIADNIGYEDISLIEDSLDNKVGSDLIVLSNSDSIEITRIELKFGAETNRNIGNNTMDKVFSFIDTNCDFKSLFSDISKQQRNFVDINYLNKDDCIPIAANLKNILQKKVIILNDAFKNQQLKLNSEIMTQLLLTTGALDNDVNKNIIKINISYSHIMEDGINVLDLPNFTGVWQIEEISMSPNSTRIQIFVKNNFVTTKFLLNWKNNYKYNGEKYKAKLGLGSTSWNVWVEM